jgi:hypothetical protein
VILKVWKENTEISWYYSSDCFLKYFLIKNISNNFFFYINILKWLENKKKTNLKYFLKHKKGALCKITMWC